MTTNQNSTEMLRSEILSEVQKECEEIITNAKRQAEIFLAGIDKEKERIRQEHIDSANAEATHRSDLILSTVPVETGRHRAARIEALLRTVYDEVRERLIARDGIQYRETIISLAFDAIMHMDGDTFVLKLSGADYDMFSDSIIEEIAHRVGRPVNISISQEPSISDGGVIVEDKDARQVWDNTLLKRLERLWPALRRYIAVQASFIPKTGSAGGNK